MRCLMSLFSGRSLTDFGQLWEQDNYFPRLPFATGAEPVIYHSVIQALEIIDLFTMCSLWKRRRA